MSSNLMQKADSHEKSCLRNDPIEAILSFQDLLSIETALRNLMMGDMLAISMQTQHLVLHPEEEEEAQKDVNDMKQTVRRHKALMERVQHMRQIHWENISEERRAEEKENHSGLQEEYGS